MLDEETNEFCSSVNELLERWHTNFSGFKETVTLIPIDDAFVRNHKIASEMNYFQFLSLINILSLLVRYFLDMNIDNYFRDFRYSIFEVELFDCYVV